MTTPPTIHLFGIRHHGPGSARGLVEALTDLAPDILLIEGPPDADHMIHFVGDAGSLPPIALLVYNPKTPKQAGYYPFAAFSPEWQAMRYGLQHNLPIRFMDLPQRHRFALNDQQTNQLSNQPTNQPSDQPPPQLDPLKAMAQAAGFTSHESWWNQMFEQRRENAGIFPAILQAMTAMRDTATAPDHSEQLREAYMRKIIRQAKREGFQRIAVVCGAWHTPALATMPTAKADNALLKGLPKIKTEATWVPWTYGRLSYYTGYGAGIQSPGWYQHLWDTQHLPKEDRTVRWLTHVAQLLRAEDLDASAAHVIETNRLATALAAIRGLPLPGLTELNEAIQTVMCFGDPAPMKLIRKKLIVGERMGDVPDGVPMVPLQRDFFKLIRRLRLKQSPDETILTLDLRTPSHLERSHLLHRLSLLGIPWGRWEEGANKLGTFREMWRIQWLPDYAVALIEASLWGNMVLSAATNFAKDSAEKATNLPALTTLLNQVILADLPDSIADLMRRLENATALSSDIPHMMEALPPLARIIRYGNVRQTDTDMVVGVVDGLVTRICIGLPTTCASLDDDAAEEMYGRFMSMTMALTTLQNEDHVGQWHGVLQKLADVPDLHRLLAGRATRLLLDAGIFDMLEATRRLQLALSPIKQIAISNSQSPATIAQWVEGFLRGSGLMLVHDESLWQVLDEWVLSLPETAFLVSLPLLRRTFATFTRPERRQIGEQVRHGKEAIVPDSAFPFDPEQAEQALPLLKQLFGF